MRTYQLLLELIFSLFFFSLSTAAIDELQIKVPAWITVLFATSKHGSRARRFGRLETAQSGQHCAQGSRRRDFKTPTGFDQTVDQKYGPPDDGDSWGFLFHYLTAIHYSARHERLLISWTLGTLVIAGPKVLEFYDDFCNHRATSLKSDGKDILAVTILLNAERDVDAPWPNL